MNKFELQYQNECMFLGCILHDSELLEEALLNQTHFIDPKNKELFKNMSRMKNENEDITFLSLTQLDDARIMSFGGMSKLADCMNSIANANDFDTYQQNILDFHTVKEAQEMAKTFLESTSIRHSVRELATLIDDVTKLEASTVKNKTTFKGLIAERADYHYNSPRTGLSGANTGFMELNKFTDGWQRSDLIIIAARPSMGKTALVLNSILNGCKKDDMMATFFSIEMAKGQIIDRFIAMESGINLMKMRNPNKTFTDKEWTEHAMAIASLEQLPIDVRDEYTVPTIRAALKRNMKEYPDKKHIAAIDFLTLIKHHDPSGNTHKDLSDIIRDLKQICKDLNVPMIVLAQLSRSVEQRQDKRPTMSDIAESGTIEQIADLISFLYRDEYYNPETDQKGVTEIIIGKNRQGITGKLKLRFDKVSNTFHDLM